MIKEIMGDMEIVCNTIKLLDKLRIAGYFTKPRTPVDVTKLAETKLELKCLMPIQVERNSNTFRISSLPKKQEKDIVFPA